MIINLFSIFVGFILLLLVPIILINQKNDKKLNIYFIIIIATAGLQRFINGLVFFDIIHAFFNPFQFSLKFVFVIPPIFFLFFETLLYKNVSLKKAISFFSIAALTIISSTTIGFSKNTNQVIFMVYSSTYMILLFTIIKKYLFNRKNQQELVHFKSIRIWAFIMLVLFTMIFVFSNYIFKAYLYEAKDTVLNEFNNRTSFVWFLIIIYILMNPVVLYGEQLLREKLNNATPDKIAIWINNKRKVIDKTDLELDKKVKQHKEDLLLAIKKFEIHLFNNFNHIPTLKELSIMLDYPQSHIKYIFKYYSYYSFSEYQNTLKIKYALQLIHDEYLSSHTLDSLSQKCLFTSRSTFFKNFKKLTGYSPTDYIVSISNKMHI